MNTAKSSFKLLNKRGNFKFLSCSVNIYPPKSTLEYTGLLFYVTGKNLIASQSSIKTNPSLCCRSFAIDLNEFKFSIFHAISLPVLHNKNAVFM